MSSANYSPRPTITRWLWLGFGLLILVLALTSLIYYWQMRRIDSDVAQVVEVQEPLERTVLQMQIAVDDTANAASDYAKNRDPSDAKRIHDYSLDFERLAAEFSNLTQTDEMNTLGQDMKALHDQFNESASETVALVDKQDALVLSFRKDVEDLDEFINEMLQPTIEGTSPDTIQKMKATLNMQDSLDSVSMAVDAYITRPDSSLLEQVLGAPEDFRQAYAMYHKTSLSVYENIWLSSMNEQFTEIAGTGTEIIQITDELHQLLGEFQITSGQINAYLSDQVQPLVHAQAVQVSEHIHTSVSSGSTWLLILGIIGILIGSTSVWAISRNVTSPIRQLAEGAAIVSKGRLDHRFNIDAKGEFGQLAFALNQMLDSLGRSRDALGESEEFAWELLDATDYVVIMTDLRGVILASNEVAAARFGRSLEQMVDESLFDLLPAGPATSMRAQVSEVVRSGKPIHYEDEREARIIDYNIYPVLGSKGQVSRLAIFAHDITMRKWVEDVTEQLGRRNEFILKAAGEGIYGLDTQGKTTFVNPAGARMLGYEPDELIGQLHHELVHHSRPDGKLYPNQECPVYAAFKDGAIHNNVDDEVFWRKDGTSFPVEYTSTPIIEDGKILGAVVTFQDITDRKRLEEVLHQSEERYRFIFESTTSLIISVDEEGTIVDCNARMQQKLGYSPNEVIGRDLLDIVHPDEQTKVRECLKEALTKGFKYNNEFRVVHKDGTFVDVGMNAAAVRDADGAYVRTICMIDEVRQRLHK
ncbi:PAS domain S-box protein [Chloroflexota bacterium]